MSNQHDIKAQRIKGYFLEAAKEIITTEGVEGISARKVADIAGYSYATIYNYFKDIDDLLSETKILMVGEVMKYMQGAFASEPKNIEDLKKLFTVYIQYHLKNPNRFRFFYFYRPSGGKTYREKYNFGAPWAASLSFLVDAGRLTPEEIEPCAKSLIYATHGLLALYFSGNGLTEETLYTDLAMMIEFILRR